MGIHKGTKLTDNPKDKYFQCRCDTETARKLAYLCAVTGKTKSQICREGIERQYAELTGGK